MADSPLVSVSSTSLGPVAAAPGVSAALQAAMAMSLQPTHAPDAAAAAAAAAAPAGAANDTTADAGTAADTATAASTATTHTRAANDDLMAFDPFASDAPGDSGKDQAAAPATSAQVESSEGNGSARGENAVEGRLRACG